MRRWFYISRPHCRICEKRINLARLIREGRIYNNGEYLCEVCSKPNDEMTIRLYRRDIIRNITA